MSRKEITDIEIGGSHMGRIYQFFEIVINRIYYIIFELQFRIKSKTNNTDYGLKFKIGLFLHQNYQFYTEIFT